MYNNRTHDSNYDCSYNYEYEFGYLTPTKEAEAELEVEVEQGATACSYSGNYSSSSSGSPCGNSMGAFERSISSLSLGHPCPPLPPPPNVYSHHQLDAPFRRVFSANDIDGGTGKCYMARRMRRNEDSPNEDSLIIQGCLLTASKYSPEQKRERIERYKNKRNHRNFQKKIQYTCRKTLADSRPRVKGRFVRNDDLPSAAAATGDTTNWHQEQEQEEDVCAYDYVGEESSSCWMNLVDCSSSPLAFPTSHYISSPSYIAQL